MRLFLAQLMIAVVVGLAFTLQGRQAGLAAFAGASMVALANALLAARVFGGLGGGGATLVRLLVGMFLKWTVLVGGLLLVLVHWKLPPLATLVGLVAAFAVNLLAFRFKG
jgi:ATP synthase protein I